VFFLNRTGEALSGTMTEIIFATLLVNIKKDQTINFTINTCDEMD
jgi:hypothetical protein